MNTKQHSGYYLYHDETLQVVGMEGWGIMLLVKPLLFWNESHTFWLFVPGPLTPLPCPCPMWLTPTQMSSETSNPQPLPKTLLLIPCFTPFPKQMASLAPSLLPYLSSMSVCSPLESHNQYFSTKIALYFPLWWRLHFLWSLKISSLDVEGTLGS